MEQGTTLHGLGTCYQSLGQDAKVMELSEQSLAIKTASSHASKQASISLPEEPGR
jgi:hypothetical protein